MLTQLTKLFLKLGIFAFGGPAAHIAMMNDEVVEKRKWFSQEEFLDLISFTNLIPGPNSTELAILIGYKQAGIKGLLVAGISFILPAVIIVLIFTHFFIIYESVPTIIKILNGMVPVLITIILLATLNMAKKTIKHKEDYFILFFALLLLFLNVNEFIVLILAGLSKIVFVSKHKLLSIEPFSLLLLFFSFIKIGAFLYGSGYVLISFLQSTFVNELGWLTNGELINLVMIGEITPGPLFTTATAIGYYLGGFAGASLSTLGIFIPSFLLIAIIFPLYTRLKQRPAIQSFISGISIASLSLMLHVAFTLMLELQNNIMALLLLVIVFIAAYRFKVNHFLLIIIGALYGFLLF